MNSPSLLSIIIPVYNEEASLHQALQRIITFVPIHDIQKEIIIIDDCSTDNSERISKSIIDRNLDLSINYIKHTTNLGKGASVQKGLELASGDYIIIQDADLEYAPSDINKLIKKLINEKYDVVYGSRFSQSKKPLNMKWSFYLGNKFLTRISNIILGTRLTDMETCYKLWRSKAFPNLSIQEKRFGMEPELTAHFAKQTNKRIGEVPISYHCRTKQQGKKIKWTDGVRAIFCILKYRR